MSPPSIPSARRRTRIAVVDVDPEFRSSYSQDRRHRRRCPTPATSCTTSAGTPARPAYAPTRRIRTSSAAIWSCRACGPRASTSSTPSPTRSNPKIVKVIEPEEIAEKAGYTRPHTVHCGPEGIYVAALGNREGKAPGRHLPDGPRDASRCAATGRSTAAPQQLAYDALVAPRPRHAGHQRMGHARHLRERARPGGPARRQVRPPAAFLGSAQAQAPAGRSISATSTSSSSSCARRTIRPRPTASSIA